MTLVLIIALLGVGALVLHTLTPAAPPTPVQAPTPTLVGGTAVAPIPRDVAALLTAARQAFDSQDSARGLALLDQAVPGVHTDAQLFDRIRQGYPGSRMPAFGQRLSDNGRWHLVNFIRTFAPRKP